MRERIIVLKLGGSVLVDEGHLSLGVHEIYRWRRAGYTVVAVVSALAGMTDRLLARARHVAPDGDPTTIAGVAANGERLSAALLVAALDRSGISASVLGPAELGLEAVGDPLDAMPIAVDGERITSTLARDGVVVVPGFIGIDSRGREVLFGRGGSDLSALFLADALGARCRLIKDVDGLYDLDPAQAGARARRYDSARWEDALATDGSIVQHKAIRFALERRLEFELGCLNANEPTRIGSGPPRFGVPSPITRRPRVALLGLGTVGAGVWARLRALAKTFEVIAVCNRDDQKANRLGVPADLRWSDPVAAARAGADIVVELMGGTEPATSAIRAAHRVGAKVVTANKRLLADGTVSLAADLRASAAVGGCAPMLERLGALKPGEVRSLRGVLNGTTNYVLELVAEGNELQTALLDAQQRGFAERDTSRDLDGIDAADKLRVIARLLGAGPLEIPREVLDEETVAQASVARSQGKTLRQVATLHLEGTQRGSVGLAQLADDDPLAGAKGPQNLIVADLTDGRSLRIEGVGAGRWPTAEAVIADLLDLAREWSPAEADSEPIAPKNPAPEPTRPL